MEMILTEITTLESARLAVKFTAEDDEAVFFISIVVSAVPGETLDALKERAATAALAKLDAVIFCDEKLRR